MQEVCPRCGARAFGHTTSAPASVTVFFDENDKLHYHDNAVEITYLCCDSGHQWHISRMRPCTVCDFGKEEMSYTMDVNVPTKSNGA
jgi:ribosomal protein L37E